MFSGDDNWDLKKNVYHRLLLSLIDQWKSNQYRLEWGSRFVGSDISWWNLCKDVNASKCVLSAVVLSFFHQDEDLALQSPRITVNKELVEAVLLKSSSKSDRKFSNSVLSWLGDL